MSLERTFIAVRRDSYECVPALFHRHGGNRMCVYSWNTGTQRYPHAPETWYQFILFAESAWLVVRLDVSK
jgi:hypothetical protein